MQQIKWVFENMKGSRWKFWLGVILHNIVMIPLVLAGPLVTSQLVKEVFEQGNTENLYPLLGLMVMIGVVYAVIHYIYAVLLDFAATDVLRNLRTKLYAKLQSLSPSYYSQTRTGDIMMRLTGDLEAMRHFVAWVITNAIYSVLLFLAGLAVFFMTNWILACVILAISPFMVLLVMSLRKKTGPAFAHQREMSSHLNATVQENISGNRVVKAFVREDFEQEKFEERNNAFKDAAIRTSTLWAKAGPLFGALYNGGMVVVLIVGGIMTIYGKMSLSNLLLFFNLNWLINEAMRLVGMVINDGQRFFSSTEKVQRLYYARTDVHSKDNPYIAELFGEDQDDTPIIEFNDVGFRYDNTTVLKKINMSIKAGQTVGIMGPTGSGKTTLTMLMARFMDATKGSVHIDGMNVHDYDLKSLRSKIGMSMQDVFLFSNTIDANIAYGRLDMEEDEAVRYAKMADAHGFINRMPDGYDTIIGERGVGLSGGQKQRVALARALAYQTPILILDDTTSAVDMETEKYIQDQLSARNGKYTTIIVAQRISSVKNADKIYILKDGEITEEGNHCELLGKKGYYHDIYCLQQGIASQEVSADV